MQVHPLKMKNYKKIVPSPNLGNEMKLSPPLLEETPIDQESFKQDFKIKFASITNQHLLQIVPTLNSIPQPAYMNYQRFNSKQNHGYGNVVEFFACFLDFGGNCLQVF